MWSSQNIWTLTLIMGTATLKIVDSQSQSSFSRIYTAQCGPSRRSWEIYLDQDAIDGPRGSDTIFLKILFLLTFLMVYETLYFLKCMKILNSSGIKTSLPSITYCKKYKKWMFSTYAQILKSVVFVFLFHTLEIKPCGLKFKNSRCLFLEL